MNESKNPENRRLAFLRRVVHWLVAGGVGVGVTLFVFIAMSEVIDQTSGFERIFRIFPLSSAEVSTTEECVGHDKNLRDALSVEGSVGTNREGRFQPLPDAEVIGSNAISDAIAVDVSGDGRFQFVTSFRNDAPSPCGEEEQPTGGERQQLTFSAPGCAERHVPVTRAWVDHRVVLDCAAER